MVQLFLVYKIYVLYCQGPFLLGNTVFFSRFLLKGYYYYFVSKTCEKFGAYTYEDILTEYLKQQSGEPHKRYIAFTYEKIKSRDVEGRDDNQIFDLVTQKYVPFLGAPHRFVYQQLIMLTLSFPRPDH